MKNFLRHNNITPVEVLEIMTPMLLKMCESIDTFKDEYAEGSILYIPTAYKTRPLGDIYIRYEWNELHFCSERGMTDSLMAVKRLPFSTNKYYNPNEVELYNNRFYLVGYDRGCMVRIDSIDLDSPSTSMMVAFDDETCYIGDQVSTGVEETIFQYSLLNKCRSIDSIQRELKAVQAAIDVLPEDRFEFYSDVTDFADYSFYDTIPGFLL